SSDAGRRPGQSTCTGDSFWPTLRDAPYLRMHMCLKVLTQRPTRPLRLSWLYPFEGVRRIPVATNRWSSLPIVPIKFGFSDAALRSATLSLRSTQTLAFVAGNHADGSAPTLIRTPSSAAPALPGALP